MAYTKKHRHDDNVTPEDSKDSKNFTLPYGDLLLDNPPMLALIVAAMDGEFKDVNPEQAFQDLTRAQTKYFSKLIVKIYTKVLKRKANDDVAEKMKEVTVWTILPHMKHIDAVTEEKRAAAVAEMIVHITEPREETVSE